MNAAPGRKPKPKPKDFARCLNRLTIVGRKVDIAEFDRDTRWPRQLGTRFLQMLEYSLTRQIWQFETEGAPLRPLKRLSARWPKVTFLLDFDQERQRFKGLASARAGRQQSVQYRY